MKKLLIFASGFLAFALALTFALPENTAPPRAPAAVKINIPFAHGSGVHIGGGFYITAGHVAENQVTVLVTTETGETTSATVLWANQDYDVALLKADKDLNIRAASLECADMAIGKEIHTTGNPGSLDFVRVKGFVASVSKKQTQTWSLTFVADMTSMGGISGAPVFDYKERLRGIVVGGAVQPLGGGASIIALTYVVPGSVLCTLLGRVS